MDSDISFLEKTVEEETVERLRLRWSRLVPKAQKPQVVGNQAASMIWSLTFHLRILMWV